MRVFKALSVFGFTLIELMITVAIIAVLSAVAIPAYLGYLRRSYLSEATTSISAIKSAEESYFTINGCYVAAAAHPASIPAGTKADWGDPGGAWARNALAVRPDRQVRFQYQVYANNTVTATGGCGTFVDRDSIGNLGCVSQTTISDTLVNDVVFPSNWYVVVARGDLNGDTNSSTIVSAIDDSTIIMCNELE